MVTKVNVRILAADQNGNPLAGASIVISLNQADTDPVAGYIAPEPVSVIADAAGIATVALWPNALGSSGSQYYFEITNPDTGNVFVVQASIPNHDCDLHSVAALPPSPDAVVATPVTILSTGSGAAVMRKVQVHILFADQNGNPVSNGAVTATLNRVEVDPAVGYIMPEEIDSMTDSNGKCTMLLWPNARGATASRYVFTLENPDTGDQLGVLASIPDTDCDLHLVADLPPYPGKTDGQLAVEEAVAAASLASDAMHQVAVNHSAVQALTLQSLQARDTAVTAATAASGSAGAAAQSAADAAASDSVAQTAASTASNQAGIATTQAAAAQASATAAHTDAGTASAKADTATDRATAAATSAAAAATSAAAALVSENNAATSAGTATTKAQAASDSAGAAAAWATSADTSKTAAHNSELAAAASAAQAAILPAHKIGASNYQLSDLSFATTITGEFNIAVGNNALKNLQNVYSNIGIGDSAGYLISTGNGNAMVGDGAGSDMISGNNNAVFGCSAFIDAQVGDYNTAIGSEASARMDAGRPGSSFLTLIGARAHSLNLPAVGAFATAIGAMSEVTTVNTVVLGRAADVTVIGATGDNGSGGKLQVNGAASIGGAASRGAVNFNSTTTYGVASIGCGVTSGFGDSLGLAVNNATGVMTFAMNGVEKARLDPAGHLGINCTNTGSYHLAVNGHGGFGNPSGSGYDVLDVNSSNGVLLRAQAAGNTPNAGIGTYSNHDFYLMTNQVARLTVMKDGNVSVGAATAEQRLSVNGGLAVTGPAVMGVAASTGIFSKEGSVFRTYIGDGTGWSQSFSKRVASVTTDVLTITDKGAVGIGTNAPETTFDIVSGVDVISRVYSTGTNSAAVMMLKSGNATTSGKYAYAAYINNATAPQDWRLGTYGSDDFTLFDATRSATRVTVTTAGNLLVGRTYPKLTNAGRHSIEVDGPSESMFTLTVADTTMGYFYSNGVTSQIYGGGALSILASGYLKFTAGGAGIDHMTLDGNGNLGIAKGTPIAKLDIGGSNASSRQAVLTYGASDVNFQLTASNGYGTTANSEQARFGMEYYGVGFAAGFSFIRGDSALNSSLAFMTYGAERMRLSSGGFLGIGISTPRAALDVNGNMFLCSGGNTYQAGPYLFFSALPGASSPMAAIKSSLEWSDGTEEQGALLFMTRTGTAVAGASLLERGRFDSSGNFLLGRASSSGAPYKLEVDSGSAETRIGLFSNGGLTTVIQAIGGNTRINAVGASAFSIMTNSIDRVTVDSSGVTVGGSSGATTDSLMSLVGNNSSDQFRIMMNHYASGYAAIGTAATGGLIFGRASGAAGNVAQMWMKLDDTGNLLLGVTSSSTHTIRKSSANLSDPILYISGAAGSADVVIEAGDAAVVGISSVLRLSRNSNNGRSLSGTGTFNASGADYAEYYTKANSGVSAKAGDIVGIDFNGRLTNDQASAISWMVKSTNPSYVGGDTWATGLEGEALEAARQMVDRIAFAGQVPVNVYGAQPGSLILPDNGGQAWDIQSDEDVPFWFKKFLRTVGVVQNVLPDGRANIRVRVA